MTAVLVWPLGLVVGMVLGSLGGGGSVLAVPALVYGADQTFRAATTTSLVIVGTMAVAGSWQHWRAAKVDLKGGLAFGASGAVGALLGTLANRALPEEPLALAFAVLALSVAARMMTDRPDARPHVPAEARRWLRLAGAGTAVGLLTGLFGVGGGFVIVPALVLVLAYPMDVAVGTSLLVIVVNVAVALAARSSDVALIDWSIAGPFVAAGVAGVWLGGALAARADGRRLRRGFAIILGAVGVLIGADGVVGLF